MESHGFVDNYMYDEEHDTEFLIGNNQDQYEPYWWDAAEPLWITATKQASDDSSSDVAMGPVFVTQPNPPTFKYS